MLSVFFILYDLFLETTSDLCCFVIFGNLYLTSLDVRKTEVVKFLFEKQKLLPHLSFETYKTFGLVDIELSFSFPLNSE